MHIKVKAVLNIVVTEVISSGIKAAIQEDPAPLLEAICDGFTCAFSADGQTGYLTDVELMEVTK